MKSTKNILTKFFILSLLCMLCLVVNCSSDENNLSGPTDPTDTIPGWDLVWSDEFEGNSVNLSKWSFHLGDGTSFGLPPGWGNGELEWYRAENATVENGFLKITAKKEPFMGSEYTSARMHTQNKGDWKYGRFEVRAKLPIGKGLWPAIWMLPTDWVYGGWAASGEIDIMELIGQDPIRVHGTLHYGGELPNNVQSGDSYALTTGSFTSTFHTFALEWEENEFRWYVDDILYLTQNSWYSDGGSYPAPFNQRFHMLLNVAVGGNWPGSPDQTTTFPQTMLVDYVRVYQKAE